MMMKCSMQCNLVNCINDVVNTNMLAEHLLQYHEGLLQGSMTQGLSTPKACGLLLSSNQPKATGVLSFRVLFVDNIVSFCSAQFSFNIRCSNIYLYRKSKLLKIFASPNTYTNLHLIITEWPEEFCALIIKMMEVLARRTRKR